MWWRAKKPILVEKQFVVVHVDKVLTDDETKTTAALYKAQLNTTLPVVVIGPGVEIVVQTYYEPQT